MIDPLPLLICSFLLVIAATLIFSMGIILYSLMYPPSGYSKGS